MDSKPFLSIDNQPISVTQALAYLRATGDLQPFLLKVIRQHLLEMELQTYEDLEIDPTLIEQGVLDFRLANGLSDPDQFQSWLQSQSLSYADFRYQIAAELRIEKLEAIVIEPILEQHFNQQKIWLDQVVLSRIVVENLDLAIELKHQILANGESFERLARAHSIADDSVTNGMMGVVALGQLPEPIRDAIAMANPGDLLGPIEYETNYSLLRVDQYLPASLEGQLKQQLQEQLFDQWLQEKASKLTIKMHLD